MNEGGLAALGAAMCWAMCSVIFTSAGKKVGSLNVNLIRLLMAAVYLMIWCTITRGYPLPTDASPKEWMYLGLSGFVGFFLGDLFLFRAFLLIGPRLGLLIMSLWPPIAALAAWLWFGEWLTAWQCVGMVATLGGVAWVILERNSQDPRPRHHHVQGVILAVLGAVGQAVGYVIAKKGLGDAGHEYDAFSATQIRMLAAIPGFVIVIMLSGRTQRFRDALKHKRAMLQLSLGSLTGPFMGVALSMIAIQYAAVGIASTYMATAPVLILPLVVVFYKEKVTKRAMLGAAVAVLGVALLTLTTPAA